MRIIKSIIDSEIVYQSLQERRLAIVAQLRGRNVQFKDAGSFLLKEARREGYYTDAEHLERAKKQNLLWYVYLTRFVVWANKHYEKGWNVKVINKTSKTLATSGKLEKVETTVTVVPKVLTEKRAEKLIDDPKNLQVIEAALSKEGKIIIEPGKIEKLVENEVYRNSIIQALEDLGYTVTLTLAEAA